MTKKGILTLLLPFLYILLTSNNNGLIINPGRDATGSRSKAGCYCHNSIEDKSVSINAFLDSNGYKVSHYIAGKKYNIVLQALNNSTSKYPKFGFQVQASLDKQSEFIVSEAGFFDTSKDFGVSIFGKNVCSHKTPLTANGKGTKGSTYEVKIPWTAPENESGNINFNIDVLLANNNNGNAGDAWRTAIVKVSELIVPVFIEGDSVICNTTIKTMTATRAGGIWETSDNNILDVNKNSGIAIANYPGKVIVKYTVGGKTVSKRFYVEDANNKDVSLNDDGRYLCIGNVFVFDSSIRTSTGQWQFDEKMVQQISHNGLFKGIGQGTTSIRFKGGTNCMTMRYVKEFTFRATPPQDSIKFYYFKGIPPSLRQVETEVGTNINDVGWIKDSATQKYYIPKDKSANLLLVELHPKPREWCVGGRDLIVGSNIKGGDWYVSNDNAKITGVYNDVEENNKNSCISLSGVKPGNVILFHRNRVGGNYCETNSSVELYIHEAKSNNLTTVDRQTNEKLTIVGNWAVDVGSKSAYKLNDLELLGGFWAAENDNVTIDNSGAVLGRKQGKTTIYYQKHDEDPCNIVSCRKTIYVFSKGSVRDSCLIVDCNRH